MNTLDKYEYNLKLEEIDKLVDQGDYEEAAKLADTIEWKRVRNVRTLCLISEIYEAAGRLPDSKKILERAYRKTPVGKNVLYRLVEVTTALQQYDEALEYYTEYVQAAPHDNNKYILKYKLYRGRGSSTEELIGILEEYLGQEYTERWAYELAKLYRDAGQMQKCFAACDDLVLWFHSGKYVRKALELKKKYAVLTPKQQQIYEECLQEEAELRLEQEEEKETAAPETQEQTAAVEDIDGEVIAEKIIAETEREIAEQVSARKAEMEQQGVTEEASKPEAEPTKEFSGKDPRTAAPAVKDSEKDSSADSEKAVPEELTPRENAAETAEEKTEEQKPSVPELSAEELAKIEEQEAARQEELQLNMARSMREIVSGVAKRPEIPEEDMPASVESRPRMTQKVEVPDTVIPTAGKLSIDDILLSMGERGKEYAAKAAESEKRKNESTEIPADQRERKDQEESLPNPSVSKDAEEASFDTEQPETEPIRTAPRKTVTEAAVEELTDDQREALQYTDNPEKLLKNKRALPSYQDETETVTMEDIPEIVPPVEDLVPAESEDAAETEPEAAVAEDTAAEEIEETIVEEQDPEETVNEELMPEEDAPEDAVDEEPMPEENAPEDAAIEEPMPEEEASEDAVIEEPMPEEDAVIEEQVPEEDAVTEEQISEDVPEEAETEEQVSDEEEPVSYNYYDDYEFMMIPEHLRGLFKGFTEIPDLEDQIANAITQAQSKGDDRTSKTGNILIFGAHASGKTTLAMNLAKAIAQDRGNKVVKMAKIFAADLNKKDIASTIAKIAGGTLIIEEAGDLADDIVEQLTTAMEFRTDGLIVILEDEQKYVHELLMRHPRFTMKFTAQIYIPEYTVEELAMFGQTYANEQDYMISDNAVDVLCGKISALAETKAEQGEPVTIKDVLDMVAKAIERSNGFFRKMSMGKKRYDENDYIILFAKDFK